MALNKEELIDRLFHKMASSNTRYPKWELHNIVDPFIEVLGEALKEGSEVRLKKTWQVRDQDQKRSQVL